MWDFIKPFGEEPKEAIFNIFVSFFAYGSHVGLGDHHHRLWLGFDKGAFVKSYIPHSELHLFLWLGCVCGSGMLGSDPVRKGFFYQ